MCRFLNMLFQPNYFIALAFLFFSGNLSAQIKIERQVLGSAGIIGNASGLQLSSTAGEAAVATLGPASGFFLTQGFQQPRSDNQVVSVDSLHIYSGLSPNGDGHNDTWVIDGITKFPANSVEIYNRWGDKVWAGTNYDNTNVIWKGTNQSGVVLTDATYFYLIGVNEKKHKGWVELTH